jgi:hypothetical protein
MFGLELLRGTKFGLEERPIGTTLGLELSEARGSESPEAVGSDLVEEESGVTALIVLGTGGKSTLPVSEELPSSSTGCGERACRMDVALEFAVSSQIRLERFVSWMVDDNSDTLNWEESAKLSRVSRSWRWGELVIGSSRRSETRSPVPTTILPVKPDVGKRICARLVG